jgi:hypothetical protein
MTCKCGYEGREPKMDFDVNPSYNYLQEHNTVMTVRPVSLGIMSPIPFQTRVHLHRNHKWTNEIATKTLEEDGWGIEPLKEAMQKHLKESGFQKVKGWYEHLVQMHGEYVTAMHWALYRVTFL